MESRRWWKLTNSFIVTGAAGFIGAALVQRLLAHGEHDEVVPWTASEKTANLMKRNNLECELFLFEGGHEISEKLIMQCQAVFKRWI